jgi:hypothetical protein
MGRDLPPRAVEAKAKMGLLASGRSATRFAFVVESHGGGHSEVEFEMSPEVADFVWQVLNSGREEVSGSASGSS